MVVNNASFKAIMEDGVITEDEIKNDGLWNKTLQLAVIMRV